MAGQFKIYTNWNGRANGGIEIVKVSRLQYLPLSSFLLIISVFVQ